MTNTTETYWDVDGVSLQTFARNIATLGGDRDTVPTWRGEDRVYAYRPGAQPRPMVADSRTLTLAMWILGMNDDGTVPADMEATFNANRRELKRLLWRPHGALFPLTKRWWDGTAVQSATAYGRVTNNLGMEMSGPLRGRFTVDVFLPDPWFYGDEVAVPLMLDTPVSIDNVGDDATSTIDVTFTGALGNATVTNSTPEPDVWFKVGYALASGDTLDVSVEGESVTHGGGANLIGALSHSGSRAWFGLARGLNDVVLTADSGAGSAVLTYRPVFF